MAYATAEQFIAKVTEPEARALAPAAPGPGINLALINDALVSASGELDTYFATRFATPVEPVPPVVTDAAIALAREALDRQGRDFVKLAADRVRKWAASVSKGVATIGGGVVGEDAPAASADSGILYDGPDRVFDDAGLASYLGVG